MNAVEPRTKRKWVRRVHQHVAWEELLARTLASPDPVAGLQAAIECRLLDLDVRKWLRTIDVDGVRWAAALIARQRMDLVVAGSPAAATWAQRDPAGFAAAFRKYHESVPPRSTTAREEAEDFHHFCADFYALPPPPDETAVLAAQFDHDAAARLARIRERHHHLLAEAAWWRQSA